MSKVILFRSSDGGLAVMTPTSQRFSVDSVAKKDVPKGEPYLVVEAESVPAGRSAEALAAVDFSAPDGYGMGFALWAAEEFGLTTDS